MDGPGVTSNRHESSQQHMNGTEQDARRGVSFGPFRLFPAERRLEKSGEAIALGSRAFDLLAMLAERPGEVIGKNDLIARTWPGLTVTESNLRVHIAGLRKALGDGEDGARYIANVPLRGYCLVATTAQLGQAPPVVPLINSQQIRPTGLPPLPSRVLGREEVVIQLNELLLTKSVLTIHGPGGIGKTTVALAVAHSQYEAFSGAVRFLDLAPLTDPALICSALASALGLLARSSDPTQEIVDYFRERTMLIVFDSCEHLIGVVAVLAEQICRAAPQVHILATSRERMGVEGEHVVELEPLGQPPNGNSATVEQVMSYPATKLFADCAAAAGYDTALTDADAVVVAEICRKLDGMALAIELVAARVSSHGLTETALLLDSRLRLLWRGRRTALPRHQTLNAVLDWSHDLIDDAERSTLRRLAVFVGPFMLSGAQAVGSSAGRSGWQVVEALDSLVAKSLVSRQRDGTTTHYRLLDTTRAYAHEKLVQSGELSAMARGHAGFVCEALQDAKHWNHGGDRAARQSAERAFLGDVQAALRWSFSDEGDHKIAESLAARAAGLFISLSLLHECRRWVELALAKLGQADRGTLIELQLQASLGHSLMFTEGDGEQARMALERSLAIAEALDDPENQFRLLSRLHLYHRRTGALHRLLPIARQLDELAARIGSGTGIAAAHTLRGLSHHLVGDQRAARIHLETALHLGEFNRVSPNHFAFHRNPYIALSRTLWLQGFADQAVEAAKPLATEAASPDMVTYCIGLIWGAAVFKWAGDWAMVENLAEKLVTYSRNHALKTYETVGLGLRGEILIQAGGIESGAELLRSVIAALRADRYDLYVAGFGASLSLTLAASGRLAEAHATIEDILAAVLAQGDALEVPDLLRVRGEILALQGDKPGAEAAFCEAMAAADRQHALAFRLRAAIGLARLYARHGNKNAAREVLAETYARFTEGFETADLRSASALMEQLATGIE